MKHYYLYNLIAALFILTGLVGSWQLARAAGASLQPPPPSGISNPADGETLSGIVVVEGTAVHPEFLRYELAFNNGGDWIVFAEGNQPVMAGTLAVWDTTVGQPTAPVFPDGIYELRLRVVRIDHNYDEYYVRNLLLSNATTPTPSPTATAAGGTPTPAGPAVATATPRPALLPSLTPFPTPSPVVTVAVIVPGAEAPAGEPEGGLFRRLTTVDLGGLAGAFWQGARLALLPFAALALYLLVRGGARRLWRARQRRWQERDRQ